MENVSVLVITKNGVRMGADLKKMFPDWHVLAPEKLSNGSDAITWYPESTTQKIAQLFQNSDALVCIFSLGGRNQTDRAAPEEQEDGSGRGGN